MELLLLLFSLCISSSNHSYDNCTISLFQKHKERKIKFCSNYDLNNKICEVEMFKIYCKEDHKYLKMDGQKVYLSADQNPTYKGEICEKFYSKFKEPDPFFTHDPVLSLLFIINSKGDISHKGFLRPDLEDYYNNYVSDILCEIENTNTFNPALINGEPVSCVYSLYLYFSDLDCKENDFNLHMRKH